MADHEISLHHDVRGAGAPVVLTHGWLNTGDDWDGVVAGLDGDVRTVAWDLRGHGRSDAAPVGQYGRDHALADLDRMVELAGSPAVLAGHSLGGYLSLAYAILHPDRVAGLVLVAAGPGFRNPESRRQWNEAVAVSAARVDIPQGQAEITRHVDAMVMDRLSEITVPVAVVVGQRDKRFLPSADVFDKHLDVRSRVIVPDTGHLVHVKAPGPVVDAIRIVAGAAATA